MESKIYYFPPLCKVCHKLNPENVLVINGNYRTSYKNYDKIKNRLPFMSNKSGGLVQYPLKLFIKNGFYR
jgi:hypothetical protein